MMSTWNEVLKLIRYFNIEIPTTVSLPSLMMEAKLKTHLKLV